MSEWKLRTGQFLREGTQFLAERATANRHDIISHLEHTVPPTEAEQTLSSKGRPNWQLNFFWYTVNLVKAGWITKDGKGTWSITDKGREALVKYPDPLSFYDASDEAFKLWNKGRRKPQRRAWLLVAPDAMAKWLVEDVCAVSVSRLEPFDDRLNADELAELVKEAYAHLGASAQRQKVDEIVSFISRMREGDIILAASEAEAYVGDVTGKWSYKLDVAVEGNLQRPVDWRNEESPIDLANLPAGLRARLQTGRTLVDLTADMALIEGLLVADSPGEPNTQALLNITDNGLAKSLFVSDSWLNEVVDVLNERNQIIFYGPPGTGKTFIAHKLAISLVGRERINLVQFHPAYTYEDFFEGYRPVTGTTAGQVSFELKSGPLRKIVNSARERPDKAFILIIDEINRANLAKVFGELYFLLEYRDEAVELLYSPDDSFRLPKNVFIIGTMNTADRSIALVDSAMRRRFAFFGLTPNAEPTSAMLEKWLTDRKMPDTAARLLVELNKRISNPEFLIGPSYFMKTEDHSEQRLAQIWKTSIEPLLEEYHYGEWSAVASRYKFETVLKEVTGQVTVDQLEVGPDEHQGTGLG